jgi:hypothetical protein
MLPRILVLLNFFRTKRAEKRFFESHEKGRKRERPWLTLRGSLVETSHETFLPSSPRAAVGRTGGAGRHCRNGLTKTIQSFRKDITYRL